MMGTVSAFADRHRETEKNLIEKTMILHFVLYRYKNLVVAMRKGYSNFEEKM